MCICGAHKYGEKDAAGEDEGPGSGEGGPAARRRAVARVADAGGDGREEEWEAPGERQVALDEPPA